MPKVKYIAEGFVVDANKLLTEFVEKNSPEFSVFTHVWKKYNFAAIFLGRSTRELAQFTQEIFQLTLNHMLTAELLQQIGAVYIVPEWADSRSPSIRVTLQVYQHFVEMKRLAVEQKYKSLHYIIGYLMKCAFDFVKHPCLIGPRNFKCTREARMNSLHMSCLLEELKRRSLSFFDNKTLREIEELNNTYANLSKNVPIPNQGLATDLDIKKYLKQLPQLVCAGPDNSDANSLSDEEIDNIGFRRAQIKTNAFTSKALFRQLNPTDEDEDNERVTRSQTQRESLFRKAKLQRASTGNEDVGECDKIYVPKRRWTRRTPVEKRRVGRPRKETKVDLEKQLWMEIGELSEAEKFKTFRRGPLTRNSCLDYYVEPFEEPHYEMAVMSSTSEEDDEDIDNPDEPMVTGNA
ncbi:snRNA-activating protein complex subunit 1 like protein [Argiope bruennichi]|uniref:snRNA-activating protein complex subunit 1 like protein n=1 Tax=Argiope bruennichi TaxID=94029 RepID=A0A8T0FP16_ARGBR|nr:snRNA-activating protein complex subunit 1 like protein [Argiope bruennichi]